jgi:hypothetical protein
MHFRLQIADCRLKNLKSKISNLKLESDERKKQRGDP